MEQIQKNHRLNWDEYFLQMIESVAQRATCDRGRSGCVITFDKRIIATGYVGSPPGMPHCDDEGHMMHKIVDENGHESQHCIRTVHAEENAIIQAARHGISLKGATLYCKMTPCFNCAKMIAGVGIIRVVAKKKYHADQWTRSLFQRAGVQLDIIDDTAEEYTHQ